jgi:hypothetical protein
VLIFFVECNPANYLVSTRETIKENGRSARVVIADIMTESHRRKTLAVATGGSTLEELKPAQAEWTVADLTRLSARDICPR